MRRANRRSFIGAAAGFGAVGLLSGGTAVARGGEFAIGLTVSESDAGIDFVNEEYTPGDVRRYLEADHLNAYLNGDLNYWREPPENRPNQPDLTYALQRAHNQGNLDGGSRPFLPPGGWRITEAIKPCKLGMYGESSKVCVIRCEACEAFVFPDNAANGPAENWYDNWSRPAVVFEKFGINPLDGYACVGKYAFRFERMTTETDRIGYTMRDLEIGITGPFGGGFYLTDVSRVQIENIGMTDVSCMVHIFGEVIQCFVRNVTSNNDSGRAAINRYGVWLQSGDRGLGDVCENVVFENCAYIRGDVGIKHEAGVHVEFINFDIETNKIGAHLDAECYMHGGIMANSVGALSPWTGIKVTGNKIGAAHDGIILDGVDINTLNMTGVPSVSFGIDITHIVDRLNPPLPNETPSGKIYGVSIYNCRIRGTENSMRDGITGSDLSEVTIEGNFFRRGCFLGSAINLSGRRIFLNRNSCPGEAIVVEDAGVLESCGEIRYNECSQLIVNVSHTNRWDIIDL